MAINRQQISRWFDPKVLPKSPTQNDQPIIEILVSARRLAETIVDNTPVTGDQSAAVRSVREAMWTAVQAIVCDCPEK
jgi:hypothetical protein